MNSSWVCEYDLGLTAAINPPPYFPLSLSTASRNALSFSLSSGRFGISEPLKSARQQTLIPSERLLRYSSSRRLSSSFIPSADGIITETVIIASARRISSSEASSLGNLLGTTPRIEASSIGLCKSSHSGKKSKIPTIGSEKRIAAATDDARGIITSIAKNSLPLLFDLTAGKIYFPMCPPLF